MWIGIVGSRKFGECPCVNTAMPIPPTAEWIEHQRICPMLWSRRFVRQIILRWAENPDFEGIVSGDQPRGADGLAKESCRLLGVPYRGFPPKPGPMPFWMRAYARNQLIVDLAGTLVALYAPGPRSGGTSDTLRRAKLKKIPCWVWDGRWHGPEETD